MQVPRLTALSNTVEQLVILAGTHSAFPNKVTFLPISAQGSRITVNTKMVHMVTVLLQ